MADDALTPGEHFFDAEGVRFHYSVSGSGPLFVLHGVGWGLPIRYLRNALGPHLEQQRTVLYFEPRGNGESSRPADEATMSSMRMADDLEHLRVHLGLEQLPALFGHSNGACIALCYAEKHPSRVGKLILVDSQIMGGPPDSNFSDWMERRRDNPRWSAAIAQMLKFLKEGKPDTDEAFAAAFDVLWPFYFSRPETSVPIVRRHVAGPTPPRVWCSKMQGAQDRLPENEMAMFLDAPKVAARTLVLWGAEDPICSAAAGRVLGEGIPGAKVAVYEGCGHFPWIEAEEQFYADLDEFLRA